MTDIILKTLIVNSAIFAVLFILMLLIRKLMKKRISAVLQYALWAVVVLKLLVPFGFESSLSPYGLFVAQGNSSVPGNSSSFTEEKDSYTVNTANGNIYGTYTEKIAQKEPVVSDKKFFNSDESIKQNANRAQAAAWPLSLKTLVLIIWAIGALTVIMIRILCSAGLKRRARHSESPIPEKALRIFESCKTELHIKRRVDIIYQSVLKTPAAEGAFRPALILPDNIETQTEDQIRHICLHELMHIKYFDFAVIFIMNALCAAYWFNPIIWLCFRLVRNDMESACDARVLKMLGNGTRQEYIGTVLYFASRKEESRLYNGISKAREEFCEDNAAIGMADGRFTMEQRVRGMFMKKRTGAGSRIVAAFIALLMLITCSLTACKPITAKPLAQVKNNVLALSAIQNNVPENSQAIVHKFTAPKSWQGETGDKDKKIDINIDAKVAVPSDTWGIYQLAAKAPDKAYLDAVLKTLIGDAKIYGEDTYSSKPEIQDKILKLNSMITQLKANTPDHSELIPAASADPNAAPSSQPEQTQYSNQTAYYEKQLAQAQQALANASDKQVTKRVEIDPHILLEGAESLPVSNPEAFDSMSGGQSVNVYSEGSVEINGFADIGRDAPARIGLSRPKGGAIDIRFQIGCGGNGGFGVREPLNGTPPEGIVVSQSDAEQTAKQKAAQMGLGYLDIASVDKMSVYNSTLRKDSYCYAFTFTRSLDGIPATFAYGNGTAKEEQNVAEWNVSEMVLGIDDSGVIYADINVPQSDVQQVSKGVELKDFSDIMSVFNRQAVKNGGYCELGSDDELKHLTGKTVNIDEIRLGYMPTSTKDHPDQIIFVPVWDFFGSEVMQFTGKVGGDFGEALDKNDQFHYDYGEQSFLTINAIDGTVMQRAGGPG